MKGYELYSWSFNGELHFCLITGTNRTKTNDELLCGENIIEPYGVVRIKTTGIKSLKSILRKLPNGEFVIFRGAISNFSPIPPEVADEIKALCESINRSKKGLNQNFPP